MLIKIFRIIHQTNKNIAKIISKQLEMKRKDISPYLRRHLNEEIDQKINKYKHIIPPHKLSNIVTETLR